VAGVSLRKVIKRFGPYQVIHGADLEVADGEFVVFVGPSGCGKSTLLRMIAGLEDITEGEVSIGGALVNDVEPADRGVAMVFQSYALYPHMTVEQNLSFGLRMTGNDKADTARRVKRTADILRIAPLLARKPRQLSGGQRQRVAIGRAIMREPQLFLFDEPLSNLDAELRVQMRVEISRLHKALGTTMIYVTHDQTEAMTLADRIVVLNAGNIEQIGAPLDLYDDPANRFVAGFVGSPKMNFMAARVVEAGGGAATVELVNQGGVRLQKSLSEALPAIGSEVVVGVRPEHFRDASKGDCDIAIKVDVAEHLGSTSYVYANTGGGEQLVIEREESRHEATSDRMSVSIKASKAFLFDASGARLR
jgi:lactose/L-arabinose transport system ATP-binding protein